MTDPVSDMFTRMRNAGMRGFKAVSVPASKEKARILEALLREGYIDGYSEEIKDRFSSISISLKYHGGKPVISSISRVSKPGCRIYADVKSIPQVNNGLGVSVISTSAGVFSDAEARERKLGGEVICKVF
ncbi:MAG: 30S ribosomal protein S8 [Holosporales bacterium]|jgi:small subunit ribosomal protein S8|nr:30S ribosomal protein S8 [Holosporales bacterium]